VGRLVGFQNSWERCQPPSVQPLFNSGTWEVSLTWVRDFSRTPTQRGCSHHFQDLFATEGKYQGRT
jgi:hypothetical protein